MHAGTTGRQANDAARGTGRAGRLALRAGPPTVTARAVGELPPPGTVARRQTAAPAVRPGRVPRVRARSGRARPRSVLPEYVPPGHPLPGGARARMPGAAGPENTARAAVPTARAAVPTARAAVVTARAAVPTIRPGVRPAVRAASPGGHLATGPTRSLATDPGHPLATVAETVALVRLARGAAIGCGAATAPDMATGIGAATGAGASTGNDREADVPGPEGTTPRPGPGTSPDRRFPTRSAPSSSTPRLAPS
jgi:hypothetical protein